MCAHPLVGEKDPVSRHAVSFHVGRPRCPVLQPFPRSESDFHSKSIFHLLHIRMAILEVTTRLCSTVKPSFPNFDGAKHLTQGCCSGGVALLCGPPQFSSMSKSVKNHVQLIRSKLQLDGCLNCPHGPLLFESSAESLRVPDDQKCKESKKKTSASVSLFSGSKPHHMLMQHLLFFFYFF